MINENIHFEPSPHREVVFGEYSSRRLYKQEAIEVRVLEGLCWRERFRGIQQQEPIDVRGNRSRGLERPVLDRSKGSGKACAGREAFGGISSRSLYKLAAIEVGVWKGLCGRESFRGKHQLTSNNNNTSNHRVSGAAGGRRTNGCSKHGRHTQGQTKRRPSTHLLERKTVGNEDPKYRCVAKVGFAKTSLY